MQILDADDERPSDQDDGFVIEDDVAMSVDDFIDENDPPEELNTSPLSDSDDNKTNEEDDDRSVVVATVGACLGPGRTGIEFEFRVVAVVAMSQSNRVGVVC